MAGRLDEMRSIAKNALADIKDMIDNEDHEDTPGIDDGGSMTHELHKNKQVLFQMIHARMVDNYLTYLTEIIVECFSRRPEAMRSSETIELSEILQYDNFDSIVSHVADKKVHSLSYKSISVLDEFFDSKFGVHIVPEASLEFLVKTIEIRNIITHNRGVKNRRFVAKVGDDEAEVGRSQKIKLDFLGQVNSLLFESVKRLDNSLRKKLKVPGVRFDIFKSFEART